MNRKDFLDILHDYLKGTFSEMEINDILRDYEEFFLNGELEGKGDAEIIKNLGSPKSIAKELIEEIKGPDKVNGQHKEKVNAEAKRVWSGIKSTGKKASEKGKEFLDSSSIVNGNISGTLVKIIMILITIILIPPAIAVIGTMIVSGLALIGTSLANFMGWIVSAILLGINLSLGVFGLFLCITWTGVTILSWILYALIFKGLKHIMISYIGWIKKRNMYVRVKKNHEEKVEDYKKQSPIENTFDEMDKSDMEKANDETSIIEYEYQDDELEDNPDKSYSITDKKDGGEKNE